MSWEFAITGTITLLVGIFGSTGFWSWKVSKNEKNSQVYKRIEEIEGNVNTHMESVEKAFMGLTYINIVKTCEYWIERGWVEADDVRDLEHYLYDPYRKSGGNGTAERLFRKASELPSKPPKEESK